MDKLISSSELARLTGKAESTWRNAAASGKVPAVKVGKTWLFDVDKLRELGIIKTGSVLQN